MYGGSHFALVPLAAGLVLSGAAVAGSVVGGGAAGGGATVGGAVGAIDLAGSVGMRVPATVGPASATRASRPGVGIRPARPQRLRSRSVSSRARRVQRWSVRQRRTTTLMVRWRRVRVVRAGSRDDGAYDHESRGGTAQRRECVPRTNTARRRARRDASDRRLRERRHVDRPGQLRRRKRRASSNWRGAGVICGGAAIFVLSWSPSSCACTGADDQSASTARRRESASRMACALGRALASRRRELGDISANSVGTPGATSATWSRVLSQRGPSSLRGFPLMNKSSGEQRERRRAHRPHVRESVHFTNPTESLLRRHESGRAQHMP